ncbi:General negative regulator of transcription subunit 4 [Bienertia sinuspersici]
MNYVPELPITYNNEMASCKNGSVARRSNRDKINTYSVSCSSSCGEDDGCLDDWEAVANALTAENNTIRGAVKHGALTMFTVLEACLVCLFCHKKILEIDGRCPGCRKHYDCVETNGDLRVRTTHPCSKNTLV